MACTASININIYPELSFDAEVGRHSGYKTASRNGLDETLRRNGFSISESSDMRI